MNHNVTPPDNLEIVPGQLNGNHLVDQINNEVSRTANTPGPKNLFLVKSANQFIEDAKHMEIPTQLFDCLWYEKEICIMFADSNVGKSILAVQIANDIAEFQKVLYIDFELTGKQFENRYSNNYANHFHFPDNFYRAEIDPDAPFEGFATFEDYLIDSLEQVISETGSKVLIIDNLTYLKDEQDKSKYAAPLMKYLKDLKRKHDLSILVLAHTPKRDLTKPLTQNDLQGSKMIMNFCDSAFAIGTSQKDAGIRYIKQIKERNTEKKYGAENVKVYQITKPDNYLFMVFVGFSSEREHLKQLTEKDREETKAKAKEMSLKGMSQREIAKELSIAPSTVNKYLNV